MSPATAGVVVVVAAAVVVGAAVGRRCFRGRRGRGSGGVVAVAPAGRGDERQQRQRDEEPTRRSLHESATVVRSSLKFDQEVSILTRADRDARPPRPLEHGEGDSPGAVVRRARLPDPGHPGGRPTVGRSARCSPPTASSGGSGRSAARSPTGPSTASSTRAWSPAAGRAAATAATASRSPPPRPAGARPTRWLDTPVQHLRDVRTELLVKLTLRERAGLDNEALLAAQQEVFAPTIDVLTSAAADDDLVDLWRRESARAVRRFLDQALHPADPTSDGRPELRLSARNQLRGTITAVHHGEVMSTIKAVLGDGQPLTAAITKDAAHDLDLAPGDHRAHRDQVDRGDGGQGAMSRAAGDGTLGYGRQPLRPPTSGRWAPCSPTRRHHAAQRPQPAQRHRRDRDPR